MLNYSTHRDATREELQKQYKRDWYHRNKTRTPALVDSELEQLEHQPSASASSDLDQSLAGPEQSEPRHGVPPEHYTLAGWEPSEAIVADALMAGLTREEFDGRIAELRNGRIGGKRGVFDRDAYVRRLLPRWRMWAEEARRKAVHPPGSTSGARGEATKGKPPWLILEPREKHRRVAAKYGLDLDAMVREANEQGLVEKLGSEGALTSLEGRIARAIQEKVEAGEIAPPKRKRGEP